MHQWSEEEKAQIAARTRVWLERAVIGLNLCPFAKRVHARGQIRYTVSTATTDDELLAELIDELERLRSTPADEIDTTLLIHPGVLTDFLEYNDFLGVADAVLAQLGLEGEIQVASFHPDYCFADTDTQDITNFTNRAPFPILHLLREASVAQAVEAFPEAESIYLRNMETMRQLGLEGWNTLMKDQDAQ